MKFDNKTVSTISIVEILLLFFSFFAIYALDRFGVINAGVFEWMIPFMVFAAIKLVIVILSLVNLIRYILR